MANLEAVCKQCHDSAIQAQERGRKSFGADGWPTGAVPVRFGIPFGLGQSQRPMTLVFGPPASGKTHHVNTHKAEGDTVLDLDDIKQELFGARYLDDFSKVKAALNERDARLIRLAHSADADARAWVILTGPTQKEREAWAATLGPLADVVTIRESPEVCAKRILADPERKPVADAQIRAAERWR